VKESKQFDGVSLPEDMTRKMHLLKIGLDADAVQ